MELIEQYHQIKKIKEINPSLFIENFSQQMGIKILSQFEYREKITQIDSLFPEDDFIFNAFNSNNLTDIVNLFYHSKEQLNDYIIEPNDENFLKVNNYYDRILKNNNFQTTYLFLLFLFNQNEMLYQNKYHQHIIFKYEPNIKDAIDFMKLYSLIYPTLHLVSIKSKSYFFSYLSFSIQNSKNQLFQNSETNRFNSIFNFDFLNYFIKEQQYSYLIEKQIDTFLKSLNLFYNLAGLDDFLYQYYINNQHDSMQEKLIKKDECLNSSLNMLKI